MKIKQTVILLLAMVVPIGVFIFLKTFGENKFEVLPLHQTGTIPVTTECGVDYNTPYSVSESVLRDLKWKNTDSLTLYIFDQPSFDKKALSARISESYSESEIRSYMVSSDSAKVIAGENELPVLWKDNVTLDQLQECFFLMEAKKNAVLTDKQRRIRGYYALENRAEVDRLLVEVKIMLKKY
jgi:hypothetical protein